MTNTERRNRYLVQFVAVRTGTLPRRNAVVTRPSLGIRSRRPPSQLGEGGKTTSEKIRKELDQVIPDLRQNPHFDLDVGAKYERDEASASNILSASITATVYPLGGVSVPLSYTYASRTVDSARHDSRFNVGLSVDAAGLIAAFKPAGQCPAATPPPPSP